MLSEYFSDREKGPTPRTKIEVGATAWGGMVALIEGFIANGGFGIDFPDQCPDGRGTTGTDVHALGLAVRAEIPELEWHLRAHNVPATLPILDLLEFCYNHVAEPSPGSYHSFFEHHHLSFDREQGRSDFLERANRILARNQIAFQLQENGLVVRLAPPVLQEALTMLLFATGDDKLDDLLEAARTKFLDPNPAVRREALEKLWDAWERLKTIGPGRDKRESTRALLDKTSDEPSFRKLLEVEASALTDVGNTFHIRHSETTQIELQSVDHVDYLFHRCFSFIWLLLRAR
ncbi:MAG: hypothetical protein HZA18_00900 [Nitrospirae bacterium]|nr:hypothetical protein [Nitrospirota bacterium]